jgi:hypothetical protein
MLEEAVTVSLTNLAPLLGSEKGTAMITASTNYFEVVFLNSVWPHYLLALVLPWLFMPPCGLVYRFVVEGLLGFQLISGG